MPADVASLRFCAQWFQHFLVQSDSQPGVSHTVSFARGAGASCTCKAYKHAARRRRDPTDIVECKHIRRVMREACLWNEQWYEGGARTMAPATPQVSGATPVAGHACPQCGGPVVRVLCGV